MNQDFLVNLCTQAVQRRQIEVLEPEPVPVDARFEAYSWPDVMPAIPPAAFHSLTNYETEQLFAETWRQKVPCGRERRERPAETGSIRDSEMDSSSEASEDKGAEDEDRDPNTENEQHFMEGAMAEQQNEPLNTYFDLSTHSAAVSIAARSHAPPNDDSGRHSLSPRSRHLDVIQNRTEEVRAAEANDHQLIDEDDMAHFKDRVYLGVRGPESSKQGIIRGMWLREKTLIS